MQQYESAVGIQKQINFNMGSWNWAFQGKSLGTFSLEKAEVQSSLISRDMIQ